MLGAAVAGGGKLIGGALGAIGAHKAHKDNQNAQRRIEHDNDVATENYNKMVDKVTTRVNKIAYEKAQAAAKVPIKTSTKSKTVTQDSGKDVTTYGRVVSNSVDTKAMMEAAEASGFNPVTWLQNGGMQAYMKQTESGSDVTTYGRRTETNSSTDTVETGRYAFEAALQGNVMPALMSAPMHQAVMQQGSGPMGELGAGIAGAAGDIGGGLAQMEQNDFQMRLQQAALDGQLRNSRAVQAGRAQQQSRSFYGPHVKQVGSTTKKQPIPMMVDMIDNRKGSPTFGKIIQVGNPDFSPESVLVPAAIDAVGDQGGHKNLPPIGTTTIRPGSVADEAQKAWDRLVKSYGEFAKPKKTRGSGNRQGSW